MRTDARWKTIGLVPAVAFAVAIAFSATPAGAQPFCGDLTVEGDEECDDGNLINYDACKNNCKINQCGNDVIDEGETCDDGNRFGGDGCAANCLAETVRPFPYAAASFARVQLAVFSLTFSLSGSQALTTSVGPDLDGNYGVVIKADDVQIAPVRVPLGFCACVRGAAVKTCGGSPTGRNCTADDAICEGSSEGDCVFVHGPGNSASGVIGCGEGGITGIDSDLTRDHNTRFSSPEDPCTDGNSQLDMFLGHEGACNGPTTFTPGGEGPPGSALLVNSLSITTISDGGSCSSETNTKVCLGGTTQGTACTTNPAVCGEGSQCVPAKGSDGIPCNGDDPIQAAAATVPLTTGTASSAVLSANNDPTGFIGPEAQCGAATCLTSLDGVPFDCEALASNPNGGTGGVKLVSAFPALDTANGDLVVTNALEAAAEEPTPTPTDEVSPTPTDEVEPTPTPTPPTPACLGDCGNDGGVTVDELVTGVQIALGNSDPSECPEFDSDNSMSVTVDELVIAVGNALNGCPA
jgi:cysteine-rich repeat protein